MTTPSASHVVCGETVVTRTPGSSAPERVDVRRRNRHPERQVTTVEVDELHRHRKATPTCFAERDALNGLGSDNDPPSDDDPISVLQVDSRRARNAAQRHHVFALDATTGELRELVRSGE